MLVRAALPAGEGLGMSGHTSPAREVAMGARGLVGGGGFAYGVQGMCARNGLAALAAGAPSSGPPSPYGHVVASSISSSSSPSSSWAAGTP